MCIRDRFSTVGYGDFQPDDTPGKIFVIVMICCALILLPIEVSTGMAFCTFNVNEKKLHLENLQQLLLCNRKNRE